jgi:hypothetical protein
MVVQVVLRCTVVAHLARWIGGLLQLREHSPHNGIAGGRSGELNQACFFLSLLGLTACGELLLFFAFE